MPSRGSRTLLFVRSRRRFYVTVVQIIFLQMSTTEKTTKILNLPSWPTKTFSSYWRKNFPPVKSTFLNFSFVASDRWPSTSTNTTSIFVQHAESEGTSECWGTKSRSMINAVILGTPSTYPGLDSASFWKIFGCKCMAGRPNTDQTDMDLTASADKVVS